MKHYDSLYRLYKEQDRSTVFAHFYPINQDYDAPWALIADKTSEGLDAWGFQQEVFVRKYSSTKVPKLKNYLNYTFKRLLELEIAHPGRYFVTSADGNSIAFNTGLQNAHASDILATFDRYQPRAGDTPKVVPDYVYKGCFAPSENGYRTRFGTAVPDIAYYSTDSRDFVFDVSYNLERDVFDHLFERAKERAGMPNVSDEVVHNYLRGAIENLIPKIRRNYKVAIPVYYVEEKRMQLLLPFFPASGDTISCFLVDRDDANRTYNIKTIYDLDQAYFAARLITRPDKDWLNP